MPRIAKLFAHGLRFFASDTETSSVPSDPIPTKSEQQTALSEAVAPGTLSLEIVEAISPDAADANMSVEEEVSAPIAVVADAALEPAGKDDDHQDDVQVDVVVEPGVPVGEIPTQPSATAMAEGAGRDSLAQQREPIQSAEVRVSGVGHGAAVDFDGTAGQVPDPKATVRVAETDLPRNAQGVGISAADQVAGDKIPDAAQHLARTAESSEANAQVEPDVPPKPVVDQRVAAARPETAAARDAGSETARPGDLVRTVTLAGKTEDRGMIVEARRGDLAMVQTSAPTSREGAEPQAKGQEQTLPATLTAPAPAPTTATDTSDFDPLGADAAMTIADTISDASYETVDIARVEGRSETLARTEATRFEVPRQVTAQVAEAAKMLRDGPVELSLSPEELGKVKMTLSATDGVMMLVVTAERHDTLDLLRRNIDQLAQDFRDLGYDSTPVQLRAGKSPAAGRRDPGSAGRPVR